MAAFSYLIGVIGFVVYALLFIFLLRVHLRLGWLLLELVMGVMVHAVTSALGMFWITGFSYWYNLSVYAFLWFCFFFVSSIYSVSVTVGIVSYLYDKPDHSSPLEEIYKFCIEAAFKERIEFLVNTRQAQKMGQCYVSTIAGKRTVQRMRRINKILGMKNSAFYSTLEGDLED